MDFLQSCRERCGQARVYTPAVQCEQWHRKAAGLLPKSPTKAARSSPCNANTMTVAAGEAWLRSHLLLSPAHPPQFWYRESICTEREVPRSANCKGILDAGSLQSSKLTPPWLWDGTSSIPGPLLTLHFRCLWCLASGQSGQDCSPHEASTQPSTKSPFSVPEWGDRRELGEEHQEGSAEPSARGMAHREVAISSVREGGSSSKDPSRSPCAQGTAVLGQMEAGKREEREQEKSRATRRERWWREQNNQDEGAWKNMTHCPQGKWDSVRRSDMQKVGNSDAVGSRRRIYCRINGLMQSWICNDWGIWVGITMLYRQIWWAFFL